MLLKFHIIKVNAFLIMTLVTFSQVLLGLLSVWNVSFLGYPARVNLFKILVECNGPKEGSLINLNRDLFYLASILCYFPLNLVGYFSIHSIL